MDGVLAPMREKREGRQAKRAQPGKHGSGPSGYREVGCGTLSFHDEEGVRLRTLYRARMPEAKKATLQQTLIADMESVSARRPELRHVYLADGADINWQMAAAIEAACEKQDRQERGDGPPPRPAAVEIVDFYHACEHLKQACDAWCGASTAQGKIAFVKYKALLQEADDGVERVINALRYQLSKCDDGSRAWRQIKAELTYFRNQRSRMRYADYQRQGLPIASGVVEAACKTLVTQRLKGSGMAWTQKGGQAVLNVRCWLRSDCFETAWQMLSDSYRNHCFPVYENTTSRLKLVA
jgi:hypothetical protein